MAMGRNLTQKRTPLEQAAFDQTVRGRYEKAQRDRGLVKTTLWIPVAALDLVRFIVKCITLANGAKIADLQALAKKWERPE